MRAIAEIGQVREGRDGCVHSLVRAFGLLDQLTCHDGGLTLPELARRLRAWRSRRQIGGPGAPARKAPSIPLPGDHLPLHTTASGKIMLAQLSAPEREAILGAGALAPRTTSSIRDLDALEREVEQVRRRGYALADQESVLGVRCVAAAVLDSQGHARAALSISAALPRMSNARIRSLGDTLRFAARRMTEDFGGAIAA